MRASFSSPLSRSRAAAAARSAKPSSRRRFSANATSVSRHVVAVVLGQALAARARVGEHLVALVAALRRRERAARRPREAAVRLALQAREVEQRRRRLARRLARLARERGGAARRGRDRAGARGVEDPVVLAVGVVARVERRVEPDALVAVALVLERRGDAPVRPRHVREHLELLVDEHRERRRLHAPGRPRRLLLAALEPLGERARRVHADQPVRLRATRGGVGEPLELLAAAQPLEAAADRRRRSSTGATAGAPAARRRGSPRSRGRSARPRAPRRTRSRSSRRRRAGSGAGSCGSGRSGPS